MPQHVGAEASENASRFPMSAKQLPKALPRDPGAASGHKEIRAHSPLQKLRALFCAVALNRLQSLSADRHQALLVTFANDTNCSLTLVQVRDTQPDEFAYPQSACIKHVNHASIPESGSRIFSRTLEEVIQI
jgi:hypothetical protein